MIRGTDNQPESMSEDNTGSRLAENPGRQPRSLIAFSIGLILLGTVSVANVTVAPNEPQLVFADNEFTPGDQLDTDRARWYMKWGYIWFPPKIGATNFTCVSEESPHYRFIDGPWNLRGTQVITDCEPLDFTNRRADQLHPQLITEDVSRLRVFYAYDPSYQPVGDWAILVEAQDETYVMVHTDTLRHLGLWNGTVGG